MSRKIKKSKTRKPSRVQVDARSVNKEAIAEISAKIQAAKNRFLQQRLASDDWQAKPEPESPTIWDHYAAAALNGLLAASQDNPVVDLAGDAKDLADRMMTLRPPKGEATTPRKLWMWLGKVDDNRDDTLYLTNENLAENQRGGRMVVLGPFKTTTLAGKARDDLETLLQHLGYEVITS